MQAGKTKLVRFQSKAQKDRIERAAKEVKRSLNQFMVMAAEEKAAKVYQAVQHQALESLETGKVF